jgi:hypothetical protein
MRAGVWALIVMAVAGCSTAPVSTTPGSAAATSAVSETVVATGTASPSIAPTDSLGPSPAPSATPGVGTLDVFPPGAAVEVAVRELNMRRQPSTSAKRVDTFKRGDVLIISPIDDILFGSGPIFRNGYTWYPVMALQVAGPDGKLPTLPTYPILLGSEANAGWVASDDGARPFLLALQPRCPTTMDLANVEAMLPAERLACFGEPLVLDGTFGCGGCGGVLVGTYKPKWLATPTDFDLLSVDASRQVGPIGLRFPPDGPPRPPDGSIIHVTVHVDDARSQKCSMSEPGEAAGTTFVVDPRTAVLYCRERFVVESYDVIGADPSFPLG